MSSAYSRDLRLRVIHAVDQGMSRRGAADRFDVSASSAIRWVKLWRDTGDVSPEAVQRSCRLKLLPWKDWLLREVERQPDQTLEEIGARLKEVHGVSCGVSTIWRFFDHFGISYKKNPAR